MCGIAGIFSLKHTLNASQMETIAKQMADTLVHRGPDSGGVWVNADDGIALSHRRLAIIDISPEGHQPMVSASGRYVVSFNGEIYNYRELRTQLGSLWRGQSDTEVMLAAIEAWGIEKALQKFNGMFAFALWDAQEKTITLARDRMGEKPLYYGFVGDNFVFASELKAFLPVPQWQPSINRDALHSFMRYSYFPAPHSIYQGIHKLKPAHYVCIGARAKEILQKPYWSFVEMAEDSIARRVRISAKEAADQLEAKLKFAVGQRMMADVPLGVFLSGGIDSSTIAALMQAQSAKPIKTFTIGFNERGFDEAPYAKAVAKHLGADHAELYLSSAQAADVIPKLPTIYDEPFADFSQIPTYLVSDFARQHVTVALSGDGGDEMFGGYNRHIHAPMLWKLLSKLPSVLRKKLYANAEASSPAEFYRNICSAEMHPETFVIGGKESVLIESGGNLNLEYAEWMMLQDALTYFPDDILTKVDRAAMAASLETRTPFTDPEVMAFAWSLSPRMKIRCQKGKWLLKQVLYRHAPKHLIERPKAGFDVPIKEWLRGSLKDWACDLISSEVLKQQGFLNPTVVENMWSAHQSGKRDMHKQLWNVLMFQAWLGKS